MRTLAGGFWMWARGNQPYRELLTSKLSKIEQYVHLDLKDNLNYKEADNKWDGVTMPFKDGVFDCAIATGFWSTVQYLP